MDSLIPAPEKSCPSPGLLAAAVFLAAALACVSTLYNGFVYDDNFMILGNRWIRGFSSVPEIFSSSLWGFRPGGFSNYYRPLVHMIFMAEYSIFGAAPWPYHLVNILMHAVVSVLVFFLALRVAARACAAGGGTGGTAHTGMGVAFVAGLLFAVHPAHVEAVAPASVVAELALGLFFLLSVLFHVAGAGLKAPRRRLVVSAASVAAFAAAAFLKESAFTIIVVIAAFDLVFSTKKLKKFATKEALRLLPYFIVLAVYLIARSAALGGVVPFAQYAYLSWLQYLLSVFPLAAGYIRLVIFPVDLNAFYSFNPVLSVADLRLVVSLVTLVAALALIYRNRTNRVALFASAWFFLTIAPVLYLPGVGVRGAAFAERYLYIPSAGAAIIAGVVFTGLYRRLRASGMSGTAGGRVVYAVVCSVALVFTYASIKRNAVWRDDLTLWTETLKKTSDSEVVYVNLGEALARKGRYEEAGRRFREALRINPRSFEALRNIGAALIKTSRPAEAVEYLERAVAINPASAEAASALGVALGSVGRPVEARAQAERALRLDPGLAEAHVTLGVVAAGRGDLAGAIAHFGAALAIEPEDPTAHYNLAVTYMRAGMVERAIEHFREVVRLSPEDAEAARDLERAERLKRGE